MVVARQEKMGEVWTYYRRGNGENRAVKTALDVQRKMGKDF